MGTFTVPDGYQPQLGIKETEVAIKLVKDFFERELAKQLNLTRVSAPLFVNSNSGINDDLNGIDRPVSFDFKEQTDATAEIVHSLAKWKRMALGKYGFERGEGLYTDMNAIRRDEVTDNLHSIFVDQWDWEVVISKGQRNLQTLKKTVSAVYRALKVTEDYLAYTYEYVGRHLPEQIQFITAQELEDKYPSLEPKEREHAITKELGAVFIMQIGDKLRSGNLHDDRAPDYDDWQLNGDILVYYPILGMSVELSSMGIRVDEQALLEQLEKSNHLKRKNLPFHKSLLDGELPYTIGGGLGQSRICMVFLRKAHIGEVQASIWPQEVLDVAENNEIPLL